jgi:carboxymethylenebutenolidase
MSLHTEWTSYGKDGIYTGYLARPAGSTRPLPAVIVIQEIWGVEAHIQDVTRRFADAGYIAFAPDLFSRYGKRAEALEDHRIQEAKEFMSSMPPAAWNNPEERQRALEALPKEQSERINETFTAMFSGHDELTEHVVAAAKWLRSAEGLSAPKVASVGFCLGGKLSAQLACLDPELAGAVIFYGAAPAEHQIPNIACPVLGFYGELDTRITEAVPAFAKAMEANGKQFDYVVYDNAPHAFFNDTRPSYREEAAKDAFRRTLDFLQRHLS